MASNSSAEKKVFKLRSQLVCHSADVRCVAGFKDGGFVTGSRDKTAKAFVPAKNPNAYQDVAVFTGPQHFVSSVIAVKVDGEMVIYVGSNDENIYCYTIESGLPKSVLNGHHGTVCALGHSKSGVIISGSWDQTARVWNSKDNVVILNGHEAAVWAVTFVGENPLTGSADKTIKLWNPKGECTRTFTGHDDVVRGLVVFDDQRFASCSNDATVKFWTVGGLNTATGHGHENYIYSITQIPSEDASRTELVTCSEDRTAKYWINDQAVQTVRLPATTVWSVAALDEQNFAVAGSNGTVYVFTSDPDKVAPEAEQAALEEEVSKSSIPISDLGDIKVDQLPGPEVLQSEGKRDGQTKLVRSGNNITCYQWSAVKFEWVKVGDVVGAGGNTKDPSQKKEYEGKFYDYVFSVDIEDGAPPLKLPYNVGENHYMAAQEFIHKHNLDQLFLEQIAQFIIKNSS
ncbi:Phospholipase A-2-activating protein [Halotydeus destructor]|nr:Phospholipase A-2-activating protein [Halotydeus destructor]